MASLLSFIRGFDLTDGGLYNVHPDGAISPVEVFRTGIRSVQSHMKATDENPESVGNLQVQDVARSAPGAVGLKVPFVLRVHPLEGRLHACNDAALVAEIKQFIESARDSVVARNLACRYARNVLNGRWLWRNRSLGKVTVKASFLGKEVSSDAGILDFNAPITEAEQVLGDAILSAWYGEAPTSIAVEGYIEFDVPGSYEVFPSQDKPITDKPKGLGRLLFTLDPRKGLEDLKELRKLNNDPVNVGGFQRGVILGQAGIRDAKISNAIRIVDTWYPGADDSKPIAVEPNGANLGDLRIYRSTAMLYNYLESAATLETYRLTAADTDLSQSKAQVASFILANIVRGGVFGVKDEKKNKKSKPAGGDTAEADAAAEVAE